MDYFLRESPGRMRLECDTDTAIPGKNQRKESTKMGGRGGSSGSGGRLSGGGAISATKERTITTTYFSAQSRGGSRFKDEVLEATADKNGNVDFSYATPEFHGPSAKTNKTQEVSYKLLAGAVNGETFGINWDKVNSVSGLTWSVRSEAKEAGLKWDAKTKTWRR